MFSAFIAAALLAAEACNPDTYACGWKDTPTGRKVDLWQCTTDGSRYIWHNWCLEQCWVSKDDINAGCSMPGTISEDSKVLNVVEDFPVGGD